MTSPLQVVIPAVRAAGMLVREMATREIKYTAKNSHDILAEADLASEKLLLSHIREAFPTHGFLSEEAGRSSEQEYMWIIDPIDGTINYAHHLDDYCISVALAHRGILQLGVIYQPATDRLYVAERGKGATRNGTPIHVSQTDTLTQALLATDSSSHLQLRQQNFNLLARISTQVMHIRSFGSTAIHMARLAEGSIDLYYRTRNSYWGYAAGILLVQEAGGQVTDFDGNEIGEKSESIVVTNGLLNFGALLLSETRA